jgi:hypothetical protein
MATRAVVLAVLAACSVALTVGRESSPAASTAPGFRTPSGNIVCAGTIRCDIASGLRPRPARPRGCPVDSDYGQGFELGRRGRARVVCAGDTVLGTRPPVLAYGRTWRRGGITCTSRSVGLTCRNLSGHGFFMSRERSRRF